MSEHVIWQGHIDKKGYGHIHTPEYNGTAHRHALIKATGHDCPGMDASHTCEVRSCINPEHLVWETHAENVSRQRGQKRGTYRTTSGKWAAHVRRDGKLHYLGSFATEEEAHEAYLKRSNTNGGC